MNGIHVQERKIRAKQLTFIFLAIGATLVCVILLLPVGSEPPKESKVIENFHAHRAAFERLREMLLEDKEVLRVASWGVETTTSVGGRSIPPAGDFPVARYNQYLALLKETSGIGAFRGRGAHPDSISIGVWASGWAADTRHVQICWVEHEPQNQVTSLDDYYQTPKPRRPVFRHIEGSWYVWADW